MNRVSVSFYCDAAEFSNCRLSRHPSLGVEMAYLYLRDGAGGGDLAISFETWARAIEFCERHNIAIDDARGDGVAGSVSP